MRSTRRVRPSWARPEFTYGRTLAALVAGAMIGIGAPAMADDGPMVRKDVARTPDLESDHAQLSMMQYYVDATSRNGEAVTLEYFADRDDDNQPDELVEDVAISP